MIKLTLSKLEKFVFYVFVFTAPFQTRLILKSWQTGPATGFNEWTSAFLYGSDLLIGLLFLLWFLRTRCRINFKNFSVADIFLAIFLLLSCFSIFAASNKDLASYSLVKIFELAGLYYYFKFSFYQIVNFGKLVKTLVASGIFQGLLAILQSLLQRSLGLKLLGESILGANFNGVAVVPYGGEKFLRAYGTFPHPNVLAAWLFLAIFAFYFWYFYGKKERSFLFSGAIYFVLLWSFFLTFSRAIIFLWLAGMIARMILILVKKDHYNLGSVFKKRLAAIAVMTVLISAGFIYFYWPQTLSRLSISFEDAAVSERIFYSNLAGSVILSKPVLGMGAGQFVWQMLEKIKLPFAYLYQPVHNIYLLIASETGVFSLLVFLIFISLSFYQYIVHTHLGKLYHWSFLIVVLSFLFMGLFDHFLWTIQQGEILFWLLLSLTTVIFQQEKK